MESGVGRESQVGDALSDELMMLMDSRGDDVKIVALDLQPMAPLPPC